jgi:hypothetical protein
MLSNYIGNFLNFFKLQDYLIQQMYGNNFNIINWNPQVDKQIMILSGLNNQTFLSDNEFYEYMKILAKNSNIDFYPTFLKIIDMLNLPELDKHLEKIFLGNPQYNCSNTKQ